MIRGLNSSSVTGAKQSCCSYGLKWKRLIRRVIVTQYCTFVLPPYMYSWPFLVFRGKSWIIVLCLPWGSSTNISRWVTDTVELVYVPRNVVRVVDRRSTTILYGCVAVQSRPHYGVWRLSKITYDCRRMKTFHLDCNDDWQRWTGKLSYDFNANLIYMSNIYSDAA